MAFSFCNTSSKIVSGAVAERMLNETYLAYSLLMITLIYPISCSWVWGEGWLHSIGFVDFAGSGVVHLAGGAAGLLHAIMLGPRIGFFTNKKDKYGLSNVKIARLEKNFSRLTQ